MRREKDLVEQQKSRETEVKSFEVKQRAKIESKTSFEIDFETMGKSLARLTDAARAYRIEACLRR